MNTFDSSFIGMCIGLNMGDYRPRAEKLLDWQEQGLIGRVQLYQPPTTDSTFKEKDLEDFASMIQGKLTPVVHVAHYDGHKFHLPEGFTEHNYACIEAALVATDLLRPEGLVIHAGGVPFHTSPEDTQQGMDNAVEVLAYFRGELDKISPDIPMWVENIPQADLGRNVFLKDPGDSFDVLRKEHGYGLCYDFTHAQASLVNFLPNSAPHRNNNVFYSLGGYVPSGRKGNYDMRQLWLEGLSFRVPDHLLNFLPVDCFHISGTDEGDAVDINRPFTSLNRVQGFVYALSCIAMEDEVPLILETKAGRWANHVDEADLRLVREGIFMAYANPYTPAQAREAITHVFKEAYFSVALPR
jgi:hypothetical protein